MHPAIFLHVHFLPMYYPCGSRWKPAPGWSCCQEAMQRDETREREKERETKRTARFQDTRGTTLTSNDCNDTVVDHRQRRPRRVRGEYSGQTRPSRSRHRPLYIIASYCTMYTRCVTPLRHSVANPRATFSEQVYFSFFPFFLFHDSQYPPHA